MSLSEHRRAIDGLDSRIVKLLNRRTEHVQAIGQIKLMAGEEIYAPHRERAVLERVCALNQGPLTHSQLRAIYREIMSSALALEKPMTIAYPGLPSGKARQAAIRRFGSSLAYVAEKDIPRICAAVAGARVDYGVVPEDFLSGPKGPGILQWFSKTGVKIVSQIRLPSKLVLMGHSRRSPIKHVCISSKDLPGCRTWLAVHFPKAQISQASSQEKALVCAVRLGAAAIVCPGSSPKHKLKVLQSVVQNSSRCDSRFLVLGRQCSPPTGDDLTSLRLAGPTHVASARRVITVFEHFGIPLKRFETGSTVRGSKGSVFLLDCHGHIQSPDLAKAVRRLEESGLSVQFLGSYPNLE